MNTIKNNFLALILLVSVGTTFAQVDQVSVVNDDQGMKLVVNGEDFMINGMNWDFIPIGPDNRARQRYDCGLGDMF